MTRTLALVALAFFALPFAARADDSIGLAAPGMLRLSERRVLDGGFGDLQTDGTRLIAPNGIRREAGPAEYAQSAPIVFRQAFIVRDTHLAQYRVSVSSVVNGVVWLTVNPLDAPAKAQAEVAAGRYKLQAFSIGGMEAAPKYGDLVIREDGTFTLGTARGTWQRGDRSVLLDGTYEEWGPATLDPSTHTLTFEFRRGAIPFKVVMQQEGEAALATNP